MAERGGQPDNDQREQAEPREDASRERENEALRARLDKLSNALGAWIATMTSLIVASARSLRKFARSNSIDQGSESGLTR